MSHVERRRNRLTWAIVGFVIRHIVPTEDGATVLGDLEEEYARDILPSRGSWRAMWWLLWETTSLASSYVVLAVKQARPRPRVDTPEYRTSRNNPVESIKHDFRFALRTLRRRPLFTVTTIATLAMGITAATTLFSAMNALGRGLPVSESHRLVRVFVRGAADDELRTNLSYPDYIDLREVTGVLDGLIAHAPLTATIVAADQREQIFGEFVTGNFFEVMRTTPARGRPFSIDEDRTAGQSAVAVISDPLWGRLGRPTDIVGQVAHLNGRPFSIIGVAPSGFAGTHFAVPIDIWIPLMSRGALREPADWANDREDAWLRLMGRLARGVDPEGASRRLTAAARQAAAMLSASDEEVTVTVLPERAGLFNPNTPSAVTAANWMALAMGAFIVLLACANVASLLLARGIARRYELGIRVAMGANRRRIARQLLTETLILAVPAGAIGLTLSYWTTDIFTLFLPPIPLPFALDFSPNLRVTLFALGASILAGCLAGLPPAFASTRADIVSSLKSDAGRNVGRTSPFRSMNSVVVTQLALSLTVLVVAGLFVRTMIWYQGVDTGFGIDNRLIATLNLESRFEEADGRRFLSQLGTRLAAMPTIRGVAFARVGPLMPGSPMINVTIDGAAAGNGNRVPFNVVDTAYFGTMSIPVRQGRVFDASDRVDGRAVAIVNEAFADRYWPKTQAVGQFLRTDDRMVEVVGIVANVRDAALASDPRPYIYLPFAQHYRPRVTVHILTVGPAVGVAPLLREQIAAMDSNVEPRRLMTVADWISADLWLSRTAATLATGLGLFALVLASVGVYGVTALSVSQRTREIGLRIALGAKRGDVISLIVRRGFKLMGSAIGVGLLSSVAAAVVLSSVLFGVSPKDPSTYAAMVLLLGVVTGFATYLPARRAASVDPLTSLKG